MSDDVRRLLDQVIFLLKMPASATLSREQCKVVVDEIKRLQSSLEDSQSESERLRDRIEELEKESEWKAMKQFLCADYHIITRKQIDPAWERRSDMAGEGLMIPADALSLIACEECGGSGEGSRMGLLNTQTGEYERINIEPCPNCDGHGWRIDEVSDE